MSIIRQNVFFLIKFSFFVLNLPNDSVFKRCYSTIIVRPEGEPDQISAMNEVTLLFLNFEYPRGCTPLSQNMNDTATPLPLPPPNGAP